MLLSITRVVARKLGLVIAWSAALAGLLAVRSWGPAIADPTNDFSFSLLFSPSSRAYHLMSEDQVAGVLEDRLDFFPKERIPELATHLLLLCRKYRFDPAFVLSLIQVESGFRVNVVSPAGAVGLMQLMPSTAALVASRIEAAAGEPRFRLTSSHNRGSLSDPFVNMTLGVAYLATLRDRYIMDLGLSPYYVLAAYNMGPAKLDQLIARKHFKAVQTRAYFEKIRRGIPEIRFYGRDS